MIEKSNSKTEKYLSCYKLKSTYQHSLLFPGPHTAAGTSQLSIKINGSWAHPVIMFWEKERTDHNWHFPIINPFLLSSLTKSSCSYCTTEWDTEKRHNRDVNCWCQILLPFSESAAKQQSSCGLQIARNLVTFQVSKSSTGPLEQRANREN